jgi:phage shock protein E
MLLLTVCGALLAGCAQPQPTVHVTASAPDPARKPVVIDVRTPEEYEISHIAGTTNVPVDQVAQRIASVVPDKTAPIQVHCRSGGRSARAAKTLKDMGYTNVQDLGSLANAKQVLEGK